MGVCSDNKKIKFVPIVGSEISSGLGNTATYPVNDAAATKHLQIVGSRDLRRRYPLIGMDGLGCHDDDMGGTR